MQYRHEVVGTGAAPDANDEVTVHYHGTLLNGEFDSSYKRGEPRSPQRRHPWMDGRPSADARRSKTTFYIPKNWPTAPARHPVEPSSYAALVFEVELIKVNAKPDLIQAHDDLNPDTMSGFFRLLENCNFPSHARNASHLLFPLAVLTLDRARISIRHDPIVVW